MSMDKDSFRRRPSAGTRLATSRWNRPDPAMRPDARARTLRVEVAAETWFSLTTATILVVTAAVATAATVQAYGSVFLPPLIGP